MHFALVEVGELVNGDLGFRTEQYYGSIFDGHSPNTTYYVAFRFENQGANEDETYYGYAELLTGEAWNVGYMLGYAIGSDNEALTVQAIPVPEPTTVALALGATSLVGCLLFRRSRRMSRG